MQTAQDRPRCGQDIAASSQEALAIAAACKTTGGQAKIHAHPFDKAAKIVVWSDGRGPLPEPDLSDDALGIRPVVSLDEIKVHLRDNPPDLDELMRRLRIEATRACEHFIGQTLVEKRIEEKIPASAEWRRMTHTPVMDFAGAIRINRLGEECGEMAKGQFTTDIDGNGDGWFRVLSVPQGTGSIRVGYDAGMGPDWASVPEPLRQGIIRLVAHRMARPDDPELPAAVAALWRPWRRLRLG